MKWNASMFQKPELCQAKYLFVKHVVYTVRITVRNFSPSLFSCLSLSFTLISSLFSLFVCISRSGRPVMALSWLAEFSPGSQMLMCLCSSWGRVCCCFLLSLATAELFWDCLTTCLCWPTPTAMELELGYWYTALSSSSAHPLNLILSTSHYVWISK